jgi:hypothetical protein
VREPQRGLTPELDDDACAWLLELAHVEHALEGDRLQVEPVRGVVVGGDGLRIRVQQHGLVAEPAEGLGGAGAGVVELDPLADPVGAGAEDHDRAAARRPDKVALLVREVEVGRPRLELGRAGVDGEPARRIAPGAHLRFVEPEQACDPRVGEPEALRGAHVGRRDDLPLGGADRVQLRGEVRVQAGELGQLVVSFEAVESLQQRFRERAAQSERLAGGAHLGPERPVRARELLEVEPRRLHRDVVERGLERGARPAGDVVRELVERVADREQRGKLRDREAGRLRGERRGARDTRVHLDQHEVSVRRVDRELDVRAAGGDADGARAREGGVAQPLVGGVVQCLLRGHRPGVAGVNADGIEVLDRADDHAVAGGVAHHLELEFLPARDRALHEHLSDRARGEAGLDTRGELRPCPGQPAAGAAEGERRPHDCGQRAVVELCERGDDDGLRHRQSGGRHRLPEGEAVLRAADRREIGADQLHAAEPAGLRELDCEVERRLAAERGQERVGPLALDHGGDRVGVERLEVGGVGPLGVGHDRRRVRVDEHDAIALVAQHTARLSAGVVELTALPDANRAGADDQDAAKVGAFGAHWVMPTCRLSAMRECQARTQGASIAEAMDATEDAAWRRAACSDGACCMAQ